MMMNDHHLSAWMDLCTCASTQYTNIASKWCCQGSTYLAPSADGPDVPLAIVRGIEIELSRLTIHKDRLAQGGAVVKGNNLLVTIA